MSYPSNELANQQFTRLFKRALANQCELIVKKPKTDEKEDLTKGQNLKETLTTSKIQLKSMDNQARSAATVPNRQDAAIYDRFLRSLVTQTEPWLRDVTAQEKCEKDLVQFRELSMIELRNLSSLARVYFDQESPLVQQALDGQNILEWFRQVYLPLRLLSKPSEEDSAKWALEPVPDAVDKNICLFLNEFTGYGHLYSPGAKAQRLELRTRLLTECLKDLQKSLSESLKELSEYK